MANIFDLLPWDYHIVQVVLDTSMAGDNDKNGQKLPAVAGPATAYLPVRQPGKLQAFFQIVDDNWPKTFNGLGTVLLCGWAFFPTSLAPLTTLWPAIAQVIPATAANPQALALLAGVIFFGLGFGEQCRRDPRLSNLLKENEAMREHLNVMTLAMREMLTEQVTTIYAALEYGNSERISIYGHQRSAFVMLGRHSITARFKQPGRKFYPDGEGCIGEAWLKGESFVELPEEDSEYIEESAKHKMPEQTVKSLGMRSLSYAGFQLLDRRGINPLGVIVFESTIAKKWSSAQKKTILRNFVADQRAVLANLLESTQPFWPEPLTDQSN